MSYYQATVVGESAINYNKTAHNYHIVHQLSSINIVNVYLSKVLFY